MRASLPTDEEPAPSHSKYSAEPPAAAEAGSGDAAAAAVAVGGGDDGGGGAEAVAVREAIESAEASLEQATLTLPQTLTLP